MYIYRFFIYVTFDLYFIFKFDCMINHWKLQSDAFWVHVLIQLNDISHRWKKDFSLWPSCTLETANFTRDVAPRGEIIRVYTSKRKKIYHERNKACPYSADYNFYLVWLEQFRALIGKLIFVFHGFNVNTLRFEKFSLRESSLLNFLFAFLFA